MKPDIEEKSIAIQVISTLVNIKSAMVDLILRISLANFSVKDGGSKAAGSPALPPCSKRVCMYKCSNIEVHCKYFPA